MNYQARPSNIQSVELSKSYRLLNHGPTVLVSSAHGGRVNVMAAAWNMALDFSPSKVCVVIDKKTLTRQLVEQSGEFVLNVPAQQIAKQTLQVGGVSGREKDKFEAFGLGAFAPNAVGAPLIQGCVAWLECKVLHEPHNQNTYDLFIGEVIAAHADERVFQNGHWLYDEQTKPELRTLHYIAGNHFLTVSGAHEVRF
jgi:flavin reductase (DIM6/NTAB) family NADH-FMN oxidoreductase RutF